MTKSTNPHTTRETWLKEAAEFMRPWLSAQGAPMPEKFYVTCSWNKGSGDKGIGQCFAPECCDEGVPHMSVCPTQGEPIRVLDILLHEMIHAAVGVEEGHKGRFKTVAKGLGLAGKMTATIAEPGTELYTNLEMLAQKLGPYPHSALRPPAKKGKGKGGSGWVRLKSTTDEDYRVVVSPKIMAEKGAPLDPWGLEMIPVDQDGDSDEGGEE